VHTGNGAVQRPGTKTENKNNGKGYMDYRGHTREIKERKTKKPSGTD
jgi:hypothetical protein